MKRTVLTLAAFLLLAIPCMSQVAVISGQVNYNGLPVASAPIRVCSVTSTGTPCTPTTPIYSNYDLAPGHQIPNPTAADQYGNFTIFVPALAAPNLYIVQIAPSLGITWSYVYNGAWFNASGGTITGNLTVTGNLVVEGTTTSGLFNATVSPYYEVNGTQIACANLSDCSNLAKLNAANVFTGTPQTAPIFDATTQFNVNGSQIASANLADAANLALLNASNTFTGGTQTVVGLSATTIQSSGLTTVGSLKDTGAASGSGLNCLQIDTSGNITNTGGACLTSPTLFYQTVEANGTAQTQRSALNFSPYFALTDSSSPSRTTVAPVTTGSESRLVTAAAAGTSGQYACWDASGGINGSGTPCVPSATYLDQYVTFTSCVPVSDGDNQNCQGGPITWPSAFADTSYVMDGCLVNDDSTYTSSPAPTAFVVVHQKTTTTFSYTMTAVKGSSGPYPYSWPVTCHGHHS